MASIFLSYARGDVAKAGRIAQALERAGHSVWWDRDLRTGSHFTTEIDQQLGAADAVVVLWSAESIGSAWVQDEAAVGRDKERLYPILLEMVSPPLGFRQFQAVDLSDWSGRGRPREISRLAQTLNGHSAPAPIEPAQPTRLKRPWLAFAAVAVLIGLAAGGMLWIRAGHSSPTLSIGAAKAGDVAASRAFAHEVALDFSRFQSTYLGSLVVTENEAPADYRAELGIERHGERAEADVSVKFGKRGGLTWADTIQGNSGRIVDLRQQVAAALNAIIRCAVEADSTRTKLKNSDFRLFLDGCTAISTDFSIDIAADLVPLFKKLTASSPDFALGHAMLGLALTSSFRTTPESEHPALVREVRAALARAKALDKDSEDVFALEAQFHPSDPQQWDHAFPIIDGGLALHPNSPLLLSMRSELLLSVGRAREAAMSARQALQSDPLTPQMRVNLVDALAYSNQIEEAHEELAKAEAIWPNSSIMTDARYRIELRYGDPKNALRLLRARGRGDMSDLPFDRSWEDFLAARADPSPAKIEAALNAFRERYRRHPGDIPGYIQALGTFDRVDEAFDVTRNPATLDSMEASTDILFRPHMRSIYSDPRFIELASRLGLLSYWRKTRAWPDFCRDSALRYDCRKEAAKYR
jgi:tetratricopeptide (TPR) repeat protein